MAFRLLVPLVVSLFLLSFILPAPAPDTLELGQKLNASSPFLRSADGSFTLSLRPFAASNSSSLVYLAISFSSSPHDHPAWVANRNKPASPSSASLQLLPNGSLTLSDSSGVIWSVADLDIFTAQLRDSGNLVLLNRSSAIVWQSFDHPTDTLLPGQRFVVGQNLTSQRRADSFASGAFTFQLRSNGVASLSDDTDDMLDQTYWNWGDEVNDTSVTPLTYFLQYDVYGNFSLYHSGVMNSTCTASDYGSRPARRLTLDLDGNLRMYSWPTGSARWIRVWLAVENLCTAHPVRSLCGEYGICILDPGTTCICPPGFQLRDRADISQGCMPLSPVNIDNCTSTDYVVLESTDFPNYDLDNFTASNESSCKSRCSSDCSCVAAVLWQTSTDSGHCWLKSRVLKGYSRQSQKFRSFLKISGPNQSALTSVPDNATHWNSDTIWEGDSALKTGVNQTILVMGRGVRNRRAAIVVLSVAIAAELASFIGILACLNRRAARRIKYAKLHGDLDGISGSPIMFSFQELEDATGHFRQILGSGAFGRVYLGRLPNGQVVAVKKLVDLTNHESQFRAEIVGPTNRESQFRAEIATIGKIHHINLLRLTGFCADGEHRLLVYEYMENGSLGAKLFGSSNGTLLDWKTRFQICLGVARGITYLHEECLDCILHCDIKPQNILLDKNNRAKVADFGLAYLFSREQTISMSRVRGTRGYLAPEWAYNRPITAKADVFSYGMLLFEILSGRTNFSITQSVTEGEEDDPWCFPKWAYSRTIEEVMDKNLGGEVDYREAEVVMKVAFQCIQEDPNARPSMGNVVQMLEGTIAIPDPPLKDEIW